MARPTISSDALKSHRINFRVSAAQYERIARKAAQAGLRPNDLARILILSKADQVSINTHALADPALVKRLERIGHNLNQLVKNAHIFKRVSPNIEKLCLQITDIIIEAAEQDR